MSVDVAHIAIEPDAMSDAESPRDASAELLNLRGRVGGSRSSLSRHLGVEWPERVSRVSAQINFVLEESDRGGGDGKFLARLLRLRVE